MIEEEFCALDCMLARNALVRALLEAKALAEAGAFGNGLREITQHAGELHDLLREQLALAPDELAETMQAMCDNFAQSITGLRAIAFEAALPEPVRH